MPGETPAEFDDPARVRAVLADHVDTGAIEIWRSATYRFAARVGTEWHKGRVLLAGDAIHQTPPFLGQGLGSGIRDAANLAWKLVHIKRTGFNAALLNSCRDERRPHVVAVVEAAKEFGKIVGELDMDRAWARDAALMADLKAGRMETRRQKFVPDLKTGILHFEPGVPREEQVAGTLMPQPEVYTPDGTKRLLDDLVPMEWLYVTAGFEEQRWMEGLEDAWRRIGGRRIVLLPGEAAAARSGLSSGAPTNIQVFREIDSCFTRWCERTGLSPVLLRPDRYIYAGVNYSADLAAKVKRLVKVVGT